MTGTVTTELAITGRQRSVAQLYQYKRAMVTFDDGERIEVTTEDVRPTDPDGPGPLYLRAQLDGRRIAIDMAKVATIEAELSPSEALLARLLACGITYDEVLTALAETAAEVSA